ncbi:DUF368 domain-containing protein [Blautia sp. MSJ-19]|uniref:DUF368 domain-containing protein n=1 Tax=Blautia sp. MSJ-19 TaxID=2841517 RepID=UPI001C0ED4E3|nr:DUF368 domain-containing protein [Blautia sp. MSJ-19]MBU5480631.1 DUF368 domain-containing protein [Blautia sp. MSJ-19]
MIKEGVSGFCMALADSVPGVSGGTIAFIMGFYDQFIGSIHNLVFGNMKEKKEAFRYLIKLGIGWVLGMGIAAVLLSSLFESHIYVVSSVFIGFIAGSIPVVVREESKSFRKPEKGFLFLCIGIFLVVLITWLNGKIGMSSVNLGNISFPLAVKLFLVGMIAISAMFLPGISGSTLLLIFGMYIPVLNGVKSLLSMDFSCFPALVIFGCGVMTGAVTVVKVIQVCLERFRIQTMYMILGMMIGSFYAIIMGPTTLEIAQPALSFQNFNVIAVIIGLGLVLGMHMLKEWSEGYEH